MHPRLAQLAVAQAADGVIFVKTLLRLGCGFYVPLNQRHIQRGRYLTRKLGLSGARLALYQERALQRDGSIDGHRKVISGDIGRGGRKFHNWIKALRLCLATSYLHRDFVATASDKASALGYCTAQSERRCGFKVIGPHPAARFARLESAAMKAEVFLSDDYRPAEDEPFMNDRQLEYFRRKLLVWKQELLEQSNETIENLQDSGRSVPDIADRASEETDRALELRTRDRQRKLVSKIDAALRRIDEGEYGYCEMTGEPISLKRLDARPIATMTLEAQEKHERREKVHRDD
jgi:DnaK suppressor protein